MIAGSRGSKVVVAQLSIRLITRFRGSNIVLVVSLRLVEMYKSSVVPASVILDVEKLRIELN